MYATSEIVHRDPGIYRADHVHCSWFGGGESPESFPCGIENEVGEFLFGLVCMMKPDRILETGTRSGVSTRYMALALELWNPAGHIVTIECDGTCHALANRKFAEQGYADRITSILGMSLDYTPSAGAVFGLLWLDSEPRFRYAELERFWPFLAPGGIACIHDMRRVHCAPFGPTPPFVTDGLAAGTIAAMSWPNDTGLTIFQKAGQA